MQKSNATTYRVPVTTRPLTVEDLQRALGVAKVSSDYTIDFIDIAGTGTELVVHVFRDRKAVRVTEPYGVTF